MIESNISKLKEITESLKKTKLFNDIIVHDKNYAFLPLLKGKNAVLKGLYHDKEVAIVKTIHPKSGDSGDGHFHNEHEWMILLKGSGKYWKNTKKELYLLKEYEMIHFLPKEPHGIIADEGENLEVLCITIPASAGYPKV